MDEPAPAEDEWKIQGRPSLPGKLLQEFLDACHAVGADKALVQTGGGNISVKVSMPVDTLGADGLGAKAGQQASLMLIKASGTDLAEVSASRGWSLVQQDVIGTFVHAQGDGKSSEQKPEAEYTRAIASALMSGARPSMETGFHALLGKAIVHTHPVAINGLLCTEEWESLVDKLYPGSCKVAFALPGLPLSLAIWRALARFTVAGKSSPRRIFLQNHGLICVGETLAEAVSLTQDTVKTAIDHYYDEGITYQAPTPGLDRAFVAQSGIDFTQHLFPDSVVFFPDGIGPGGRQDIALAWLAIAHLAWQVGSVHYLPADAVSSLLAMEAERFRRRQGVVASSSALSAKADAPAGDGQKPDSKLEGTAQQEDSL
ncbi:hypothetical protein AUJ68_06365 [Candidatus Woesearchaeota archaeon CG1_02_57_44]|nr:MAG: hypothetical protein AUJ68_06365 [Candidatus Woesearchaeota archaeon CG1_02_57_44]